MLEKMVDVRTAENRMICRALKRDGTLFLAFKTHGKEVVVKYEEIPMLAEQGFMNAHA